jgi:hypothetical protein
MRGLRFHRGYVATAVFVAAVLAASLSAVPASATATAKSVTCTSLSGNLNSPSPVTFSLGGCSGNTGGSGSAQGNTISWHNGRTTYLTLSAFPLSGGTRKANCGAGSEKYTLADSVAGDATGSIKAGGKVSAKVCIFQEAPDPWSLAPGSVLTLR